MKVNHLQAAVKTGSVWLEEGVGRSGMPLRPDAAGVSSLYDVMVADVSIASFRFALFFF